MRWVIILWSIFILMLLLVLDREPSNKVESTSEVKLAEVHINMYCVGGLVAIASGHGTMYYRKPDNSLVKCEEYNALVTNL